MALQFIRATISINFHRGYTMIDHLGAVAALLNDHFDEISWENGPTIRGRSKASQLDEGVVNLDSATIAFSLPDTPQLVIDQGWSLLRAVTEAGGIEKATSLSLQLQYIEAQGSEWPVFGVAFAQAAIPRLTEILTQVETARLSFDVREGDDRLTTIQVTPSIRSPEGDPRLPSAAIVYDGAFVADGSTEPIPVEELRRFLRTGMPTIDARVQAAYQALGIVEDAK